MSFRLLSIILAAVLCAGPIRAQERPDRQSDAVGMLTAAARSRVARSDTTLAFRTRAVEDGRKDVDAGVFRAAYRVRARVDTSGSPEQAARSYLRQAARQFGWPEDSRDLIVRSVRTGAFSSHVVFQQVMEGVPVYNRFVAINLDTERQPTMVLSGYAIHLAALRGFSSVPGISATTAREEAARMVSPGPVTTSQLELVVYPSSHPRLAWRLIAWPQNPAAEWEVLLDAHTGELIQLINQATHVKREGGRERGSEGEWEKEELITGENLVSASFPERKVEIMHTFPLLESEPKQTEISSPSLVPSVAPSSPHPYSLSPFLPFSLSPFLPADGSGLVFDPDPVTSAGVAYGGSYQDWDDADVPELAAQLKPVVLRDITLRNGRYYLEGPYVTITGSAAIGGSAYEPPSESAPNAFGYARSDDHFEAVMAYHHIDESQRYVQSLDVGRPIHAYPVRVNPHGLGNDDASNFYPSLDAIAFGGGGIDDAEDAQVIWHEYAHALLEASAPGHITGGGDGLALHEGWADYWAASYVRDKVERGELPATDWRRLFRWDGNNPPWCGRTLDHGGQYPDDVLIAVPPGCSIAPVYHRGLLWATTLMEIYTVLGRTVTDRLNLASHGYLGAPPVTFRDAAEAILQADVDLYGGAHVGTVAATFVARGFLDEADVPPRQGPDELLLYPNYPEPFSGTTKIIFRVPASRHVVLELYDLMGRRIRVLEDGAREAGTHTVLLDGSGLASGTYLLRMRAGDVQRVEPVAVVK